MLRRHPRVFLPLLGGVVALAWLILWLWSRSPWERYLRHDDWLRDGPAAWVCRSLPGVAPWVPLGLAEAAWILMIAAMMLPSTLPLMEAFDRVTGDRADRAGLLARVILGYLLAWAAFGLVAHGLQLALQAGVARVPALAAHPWAIGAATLGAAGAFQFSALKHRCLEQCRTPRSFVIAHWHGRAPRRDALALGLDHGLFCVGCCWALMLLMVVVGAGSLGWMLLLGATMAVEKNVSWGRRLSAPLGWGLLAWAGLTVARYG